MDRRATLSTLLGRSHAAKAISPIETPKPPVFGLAPYAGTFGFEQAAHLLRRTTFGPKYAQIKDAVSKGLNATLNELFKDNPLPNPPLNYDYTTDPNVPVGSTWIDAPYVRDTSNGGLLHQGYRNTSLRTWTYETILNEGTSIREQLTLFWHNHFGIGDNQDPKFWYRHITLLRTYAWGNFKELIKKINIDPLMLRFLNSNQNTVNAPNENYAREVLELFTIGKGPLVGPGDYTNYTEQDIREFARALTGWRDQGYNVTDATTKVGSFFRISSHDAKTKKLSHRFDETVINNGFDKEHETVVDIIFTKKEVARFICRKLYRWFVYYEISTDVEQNVIEPMADILVQNNYEIKPALMALLKSEHFFDVLNMGPMIKNPIVFSLNLLKQIGWNALEASDLATRHKALAALIREVNNQQMVYFDPPDVAGWKPYYQEPAFYRIWINATTLQARMRLTDRMATNNYTVGVRTGLNVLNFANTMPNPNDPYLLVEDMVSVLLPQSLTDPQMTDLMNAFLAGTPDYEWNTIWTNYTKNPGNNTARSSAETKLRNLVKAILSLPEFFLS
ncbi:DUF1800 domain-containing protein [Haliscomenobacter sp.]|uniref:DUF1800 domain-containing protein n=1 Tax=Haliscomenobacter sp. TaxID=2717303 RepID=UPI003BA89AA4